jgi:hypothetical protein
MQLPSPSASLSVFLVTATLLSLPSVQGRDRFFEGGTRAQRRAERREESDRRDGRIINFLGWNESSVRGGPKRVEVDLSDQRLRAWEGDRLVMQTRISSGRNDATPTGHFSASWKDREHYSTLYHHAYMPWAVQVAGDVFIHGYSDVPRYPASHGCIRLPVSGRNPAKQFYDWVSPGTPVRIVR